LIRLTFFSDVALLTIRPVQCGEITRDAGFDLFHSLAELSHREVLFAIVHGLKLAAIDRHNGKMNGFRLRQSSINCRHTARIASPLSLRKSAIVLKSSARHPTSHISSIDLTSTAILTRFSRAVGLSGKPSAIYERFNNPDRLFFRHIVVQTLG